MGGQKGRAQYTLPSKFFDSHIKAKKHMLRHLQLFTVLYHGLSRLGNASRFLTKRSPRDILKT